MSNWARRSILLVLGWLLLTVPARASFHLMMVVEVFPGVASNPNAQYVELQMYFAGQNFVTGHSVLVYDAAGTLIGTFTFPAGVANGADQASILIATTQAQTLFGVTADLTMTPLINPSGGKVCFDGPIPNGDCVAWGNYSGPPLGVGAPFSPGGLPLGQAVQRRLDRGTPDILDTLDDTNDSATDFISAPPTPRNNADVVGVAAQDFFSLSPCRLLDTRGAVDPLGGPALVALDDRVFVAAGTCGVPADAKAISLNIAVTQPTVAGNIRLHAGGTAVPLVSAINYKAGQTRSNNAVIPLSAMGELAAYLDQVSGTAHLIVDVNGYFK